MTNVNSILYRKNYFASIWFSLESQHENRYTQGLSTGFYRAFDHSKYIGDILILFSIVVDNFHFPVVQIKSSIEARQQIYGD